MSYSFIAPAALERLRLEDASALRLTNPLSQDQSVMRPLLLPGLLDAAAHNAAHGRDGVRLFESARAFRAAGPLDDVPGASPEGATPADESQHLAALLTVAEPGGWRTAERPPDYHSARALVDALMASAGVDWRAEPAERPFLHPGRAAAILAGADRELGWVGELHPTVSRDWELDGPVAAFELDLDLLTELAAERSDTYRDVTSFPSLRQDIAVVVPEHVPAAEVERAVRAGAGELLAGLSVFDLYRGEQVGEGRKSLALRLEFRAPDRTLTDEDVVEPRARIEQELSGLGGALRA